MTPIHDDGSPFQFTAPWFSLGIVTPEQLATMRADWDRSEDRSPEHYRWRAFRTFLDERRPLPPDTALALYRLGATDPDRPMGEAMMHTIVDLPECPDEIVVAAAGSGIRHLIRAAERRAAAI